MFIKKMAFEPSLDLSQLNVFRTKRCQRKLENDFCCFGNKCQYSHDSQWIRRSPFESKLEKLQLRYICTYCPSIRVKDGSVIHNSCSRGRSCGFAHSVEEFLFHPTYYKTSMCPHFTYNRFCPRYYCHYAHYDTELRGGGFGIRGDDDSFPNDIKYRNVDDFGSRIAKSQRKEYYGSIKEEWNFPTQLKNNMMKIVQNELLRPLVQCRTFPFCLEDEMDRSKGYKEQKIVNNETVPMNCMLSIRLRYEVDEHDKPDIVV